MKLPRSISAAFLYLLVSCAGQAPSPTSLPSKPVEIPSIGSNTANTSWGFIPRQESHTYQSKAVMILEGLPSSPTSHSKEESSAWFSVRLDQQQSPAIITGQIDSLSINGHRAKDLSFPLFFNGTFSSTQLTIELPSSQQGSMCTSRAPLALGDVRAALVNYPLQLQLTSTWTDSISTTTCSGVGIPTALHSLRSYQVKRETPYGGIVALLLTRTEILRIVGAGVQGQHQLGVQGNGTALSDIYLNKGTGSVLAVETTQTLNIAITSSGRVSHFLQSVQQQINLLF